MKTILGTCLCGGVQFEVTGLPFRFLYCHCRSCRKSTGSAHVSNLGYALDALRWIQGEDQIRRYVDESDNPGFTRCFCASCGSVLPKKSRNQEFWVVPAGLLEGDPGMRPEASIFWSESASWYLPVDSIPKFEERFQG